MLRYFYGILQDAVRISNYMRSTAKWLVMDELESLCKEANMSYQSNIPYCFLERVLITSQTPQNTDYAVGVLALIPFACYHYKNQLNACYFETGSTIKQTAGIALHSECYRWFHSLCWVSIEV